MEEIKGESIKGMKILSLSASYPTLDGKIELAYIHTRNKYYKKNGIDIQVLNFKARGNYLIDEIPVYTKEVIEKKIKDEEFDILICHAPNIKNHYVFLKKNEKYFKKIVFVFHGHEVLKINKVYSEPFEYTKKNSLLKKIMQDLYDNMKLKLWRNYYIKIAYKSKFMFVSEWMYHEFLKWTKISEKIIKDRKSITYNCVGAEFEILSYDKSLKKEYDFITIRGNLDGSKYCIDIVNRLAFENPSLKFLVIGRGYYFSYNKKADNVKWLDKNLSHKEIIDYLNLSRCSLMPTRTDAQGLMMCEMATFGIPLITSNIFVCNEIFKNFKNVRFISNEQKNINLKILLEEIENNYISGKSTKYFNKNTSGKEIELFKNFIGEEV